MAHLLKSFLSIPNFLVVHDCRQNRLSADVAKEDGGHRSRQKDDDGTNGQSEKCGGKSRRRPYAAARRKPRHWAREQSVEAPLPDRSRGGAYLAVAAAWPCARRGSHLSIDSPLPALAAVPPL